MTAALVAQSDPPVTVARSAEAVLAFESDTSPLMLRSRGIQALEQVAADDRKVIRPIE